MSARQYRKLSFRAALSAGVLVSVAGCSPTFDQELVEQFEKEAASLLVPCMLTPASWTTLDIGYGYTGDDIVEGAAWQARRAQVVALLERIENMGLEDERREAMDEVLEYLAVVELDCSGVTQAQWEAEFDMNLASLSGLLDLMEAEPEGRPRLTPSNE